MRVLIADRNARLLESISRTFARQFAIETAASCERCSDLLAAGAFDLVLISEKLADGPGLALLGQIARSSPDTLRVFAARRSRLQLLKGKLGPFGLFRTLGYPINPQELLSTLTLAQTGLAIGAPSPDEPPSEVRPDAEVPAPTLAPAEVSPVVERISLTTADAAFAINVPQMVLSQRRVRRAASGAARRPASDARPMPPAPPLQPAAARRSSAAAQQAPAATQQAPAAPQPARAQQHAVPQPAQARAENVRSAAQPSPAQAPPVPQSRTLQHAARRQRRAPGPVANAQPAYSFRSKAMLASASVVVFVLTTFTLNLNDASIHVTRASTPAPKMELPAPTEPPAALAPAFRPEPSLPRRIEPKPPVDPASQPVTASNAPVADPSSFGHEAYEVIYEN